VTMADIVQIDKCMIKPSAQLCAIDIIDRQMEYRLLQLARNCYSFEANCQAEPSRLISQLVERCVTCTEHVRGQTSGTKRRQRRRNEAISLLPIITGNFAMIEIPSYCKTV
jgi:hypothetical protein